MKNSYDYYPEFKAAQEKFLADIEAMPQAIASFLPDISAEVSAGRSRTKSHTGTLYVSPEHSHSKTHSVQITQNIFRGGGSMAAIAAAQKGFKASRAEYFLNEQKLFMQVLGAYVEYLTVKEKTEINDSKLQAALKRLEASEATLDLGLSTRTDVAQAQAQVARATFDKAQHDAALQYAYKNFVRIVGVEPENLEMPTTPQLPKTMDEFLSKAKVLDPNLKILKNRNKQARYHTVQAQAKLLPTASLNASVSRGVSSGYSNGPFGTQYSKQRKKDVQASLSVKIPIFSNGGAEYSAVRSARKNARRISNQYQAGVKEREAETIKLWENYHATQQMVSASQKQIDAETLALEGIGHEKELGLKSLLDVLTAEDKLYQARISNIDARQRHILNAYQISAILGDMTARSMAIPSHFNPEYEFKKIKTKIIGF